MSDLEDMNLMIGNFPGDEFEGNSLGRKIEVDLTSSDLHESRNMNNEEFRSILTSNSGENSEVTAETARLQMQSYLVRCLGNYMRINRFELPSNFTSN